MLNRKHTTRTLGMTLAAAALAGWALLGYSAGVLGDHKPGHDPPGGGGGGGGGGGEPRYTLIDLGTLGTLGWWRGALSVNNLGQVVGGSGNAEGVERAFLLIPEDTNGDGIPDTWFQDAGTGPNGESSNGLMIDLGTLATGSPDPDWDWSWAVAVNNVGQVTGGSTTDYLTYGYPVEHGFVIVPDGDTWFRDVDPADGANDLMIDLGTLATFGDGTTYSRAISDSGYVAGYIPGGANGSAGRAFIVVPEDTDSDGIPDTWFRDVEPAPDGDGGNDLMIDLGGGYSRASAVNDDGWVAGDVGFDTRAFLIIPEDNDGPGGIPDGIPDTWFRDVEPAPDGDGVNDLMIMLPMPDQATHCSAGAMNSSGQVVGYSWKHSNASRFSNFLAVLWDINSTTRAVTVTELGRIKGEKMITATGINNVGQVVGIAWSSWPSFSRTPFLWENGEIYNLLDLISNSAGIESLTATDINDSGQIVGGRDLAYIAIPLNAP